MKQTAYYILPLFSLYLIEPLKILGPLEALETLNLKSRSSPRTKGTNKASTALYRSSPNTPKNKDYLDPKLPKLPKPLYILYIRNPKPSALKAPRRHYTTVNPNGPTLSPKARQPKSHETSKSLNL